MEECIICIEGIDINKTKTVPICENKHYSCGECINYHVAEKLLSSLSYNFLCPVENCGKKMIKCNLKSLVEPHTSYAIDKADVLSQFELPKNLKYVECPLCPANESAMFIFDEKDCDQYYFCNLCKKKLCLLCFEESPNKDHTTCKKYYSIFLALKKLSEMNYIFKCLKCNVSIVKIPKSEEMIHKVEKCNHMKCVGCLEERICYVCNGDISEFEDKKNIFSHNNDWKTKASRCPLYMENFSEIPELESWKTSDVANHQFNRYRLESTLNAIRKKFNTEDIKNAYLHYSKRLNLLSLETVTADLSDFKEIEILEKKIYNIHKL